MPAVGIFASFVEPGQRVTRRHNMFERILMQLAEVDVNRIICGTIFGSLVSAVIYGALIL